MPYLNEGGVKFTDHHISSLLQNIANSCGVCHREKEETLRQNVYARQDRIDQLRRLAEDSITKAHIEAKAAWDAGATEAEMKPALQLIRQAQWRWDWVAAHNGMGFYSPQECARVESAGLDAAEFWSAAVLCRWTGQRGSISAPLAQIRASYALLGHRADTHLLRMA